jgi:outer membrane biosynthesis protein TonB
MRKLLTLAIPLILGVGLLTAAFTDPRQDKPASSRRQAGVATEHALPAVIEESPTSTATLGPATSTTAAPAPAPAAPEPTTTSTAPQPTTTSTAAKPMTTVTTKPPVAAKPKPKPAPATTTTLAPAPEPEETEAAAGPSTIDCGQGTASARAIYGSNKETSSLYAEIENESNREIELDRLSVNATYPDGGSRIYMLEVAGRRVQPGEKIVISIPDSAPQGAPKEFTISEFGFHTAGMPECASH